jgi:hypothetical protein
MNTFNSLVRLFLIVFSLFWTFLAQASDFQSPRTAALGGAGHAGPLLSDALYMNPAFGTFIKTHSLSVNYQMNNLNGHIANASVLDGTEESLFQAGLGFTRREDANIINVGASKSIIQKMGMGIGAKFIFPNDGSGKNLTDGTFSMIGFLGSWVQTALIVDNLFQVSPEKGFLREVTVGTKFNVDKIILVYIDPHWVPDLNNGQSNFGVEAGLEFPFFSDLFLRMGVFTNSWVPSQAQRGEGFGLGAGWLGPKMSIDYGLTRVISPASSLAHTFGMTIFF